MNLKISTQKPTESEAVLFDQLVVMACRPKSWRRRMQVAKRVAQASRLPVSESKRDDACGTISTIKLKGRV